MRLKCFKILELIIGWKNYYWVLCLSGAFVFKRHFAFFLVYYAAFSGVYLYCLIVILLLKPKNIQRSPETCDGEAQGDSGISSGKEAKQLLLAQGRPSWQLHKPGQGGSPGLEEDWGSAFLSHQVIRSTFFFF